MAEEQPNEVEKVQPEDPQFGIEEHIKMKRNQEVLNKSLRQMFKEAVCELQLIMDGTTYAYTRLPLPNKGIKEINELIWEYPHLRKVQLPHNRLSSINAILKLKYLTQLDLSKNLLQEIKFISNDTVFPYLKKINLSGNKIQTLPMLVLKNVKFLNLSFNSIVSLQEFEDHPKLQILELRGNKIQTLKGFSNFPSLRELYIADNKLQDFQGLQNVAKLTKLHARKNKIAKLSTFPKNVKFNYLNIRENLITKVEDLSGIDQSIRILNLIGNPISEELADNTKKQVYMRFKHYDKINKQEITNEEKDQFDKEYRDRLAEQQRERLEKEAAEKQAQRQAAEKQAEKQQ